MAPSSCRRVGALMWAVQTRMDIAYAVHRCARYAADESRREELWRRLLRIVAYLKSSVDDGVIFAAGDREDWPRLCAFADSDFAGDADTRRSTTGIVVCYNGAPVYWKSVLQSPCAVDTARLPALSSGQAEFNAVAQVVQDCLGFRNLLAFFDELEGERAFYSRFT